MNELRAAEHVLRTAAWYGDEPLEIPFPPEWDVATHWPATPPPLSEDEIRAALARPVEQAPIRELCRGKKRPLVIVDDLTRPTPAARVLPFVLEEFRHAGIPAGQVRILMATGTHGPPEPDAFEKKVGREAAAACQLLAHDCTSATTVIGVTSFGTPVAVDPAVPGSDFVLGICGIFPSGNTGFSGGSKLALGVLSFESIARLHKSHPLGVWGAAGQENEFRRDVNEIAAQIGMCSMISLHLNADRKPVRVACGNHFVYHARESVVANQIYAASPPGDADVVIANCYPGDVSLRMASAKGFEVFRHARPDATRIAIAACSEGRGIHRLFPLGGPQKKQINWEPLRRITRMSPGEFARKVVKRLGRQFARAGSTTPVQAHNPDRVWVYRTRAPRGECPAEVGDLRVVDNWAEIFRVVRREQGENRELRVVLYACAPLQHFAASAQMGAAGQG